MARTDPRPAAQGRSPYRQSALGAPIALLRLVLRRWPEEDLRAEALLAGRHADLLTAFVVITATDGNHRAPQVFHPALGLVVTPGS